MTASAAASNACVSPDRGQIRIPASTFHIGSEEIYNDEGPVRLVTVPSFSIDRFDVTDAQFAQFVTATGYVTDVERKPDPEEYPEIERDKLASGGAGRARVAHRRAI